MKNNKNSKNKFARTTKIKKNMKVQAAAFENENEKAMNENEKKKVLKKKNFFVHDDESLTYCTCVVHA